MNAFKNNTNNFLREIYVQVRVEDMNECGGHLTGIIDQEIVGKKGLCEESSLKVVGLRKTAPIYHNTVREYWCFFGGN